MAYKFEFSPETLKELYLLREYAGAPSMAAQVRGAVSNYLQEEKKKLGAPIGDIAEAIDAHDRKKKDRGESGGVLSLVK